MSRRSIWSGARKAKVTRIRPPGAVDRFADLCSRCDACVAACPEGIIGKDPEDGLPFIDFAKGGCTHCSACVGACETGALDQGGAAFRHHAAVTTACLALDGVFCSLCEDSCEADALRFRPRVGGKRVPAIDPAACTGCGSCVHHCPNDAITLVANAPKEAAA